MQTILVLGGHATGCKQSLLNRYVENTFPQTHKLIGVRFKSKAVEHDGAQIRLQIWIQGYSSTYLPENLKGAHAIIVGFDVTRRDTFEEVPMWLDYIREHTSGTALIYLVGNQIDLVSKRVVSQAEMREFAALHPMLRDERVHETSAKTGQGVKELFSSMTAQLLTTARRAAHEKWTEQRQAAGGKHGRALLGPAHTETWDHLRHVRPGAVRR